jgi:hypothetical protein
MLWSFIESGFQASCYHRSKVPTVRNCYTAGYGTNYFDFQTILLQKDRDTLAGDYHLTTHRGDAIELMQGDVSIQMPTDLHTVAPFELESEFHPRIRKGITALTVDIPSSNHRRRSDETRPSSRWKTPEFALYYAAFLTVVPIMIWVPVNLSSSA